MAAVPPCAPWLPCDWRCKSATVELCDAPQEACPHPSPLPTARKRAPGEGKRRRPCASAEALPSSTGRLRHLVADLADPLDPDFHHVAGLEVFAATGPDACGRASQD